MAEPTTSVVDIAKYLQQLMVDNVADLGFQDVFYGDQQRIPRSPAACVDPGEKTRELNGAPRRTMVVITNYIIVYHGTVQTTQQTEETNGRLSELLEAKIHADAQMGGRVVDSLVTSVEFGFAMRNNSLFRSSRLTVEARQQEQLPNSF